jgi:hypothetical protein
MSKFSAGLYRPYLQPMTGLGQGERTLSSMIFGGPRGGAGSAIRIYNFYRSLPEPYRTNYLINVKKNATTFTSGSGKFSLYSLS